MLQLNQHFHSYFGEQITIQYTYILKGISEGKITKTLVICSYLFHYKNVNAECGPVVTIYSHLIETRPHLSNKLALNHHQNYLF